VIRRVAFAVVVLLCMAAPVRAQIPPPPPQTAPVFELIAPTVSPVCGNALLVAALAPGIVAGETGGALPLDAVTPVLGPVFEVCGAVPTPPELLTCDADTSANNTANAIAAAIAGTQLPVGFNPFGNEVEQAIVIQDKLPPPANSTGLLDQVVATLNCKAEARPTAPPEEPTPPASDDENFDDSVLGDFTLAPLLDTLAPDVTTISPAPSRNQALPITPAGQVGDVGFLYPVVFALPLVLLVLGGYLGRSLTQPVAPPHR
jgi:hypothetical protein